MKDAPLMPGKSIDDLLSGKRITLTRVDAEGAHIHVDAISESSTAEPVAVVPDDFSIVARQNDTTIRNLDGSKSTGHDFVWKSLSGTSPFGLQEVTGGPSVNEVRTSIARAYFSAGKTGEAKY